MTVVKPIKSHTLLAQGEYAEQQKPGNKSGKSLTNWLLKNQSKPKSPQKNNNYIERFASLKEMKRP